MNLQVPVSGAADKIRCTVVLSDGELSDEAYGILRDSAAEFMTDHGPVQLNHTGRKARKRRILFLCGTDPKERSWRFSWR